jgi:uncharacterized delta-60 repeat protein
MEPRLLKRALVTSLVFVAFCGIAAPAGAAVGVDRGFGDDGVVEGRFGSSFRPIAFHSLRAQTDGSVVPSCEGEPLDPEGKIAAVVHFKVEAVVPLPSGGTLAGGAQLVHIEESGGTLNLGVQIARLDGEGHLDPSFGSAGIVSLGGGRERLVGIFPREGGRLGAVTLDAEPGSYGQATVHPASSIVELDSQGEPEPGFGSRGTVSTPRTIEAFHLLADGSLLVAGEQWVGAFPQRATRRSNVFVSRYTPAGELDPGFGGGDGIASLDLGDVDLVGAALWESDGAVAIGGVSSSWGSANCIRFNDWCAETPYVARFTPAGVPDPGFGTGGITRLEDLSYPYGRFEGGAGVLAMASRPQGGLYAAGGSGVAAFVAALTLSGGLDPGYGSGGVLAETDPTESRSAAHAVAVDARGRLLVAGGTAAGVRDGSPEAGLFRYLPDGTLDSSFGGGFVRLPGYGSDVALAEDGSAFVLSAREPAVSKILPSGERDRSFGAEGTELLPGVVTIRRHGRREKMFVTPRSIAMLPGGRVLVAATAMKNEARAVVFRLRPGGTLDSSFGRGGLAVLGFGPNQRCEVEQMALQPDGHIVLVGQVDGPANGPRRNSLAVMRLRSDGSKDPSFNGDGLVVKQYGVRSYGSAVALQGRDLLVAGRARTGSRVKEVLLRLRPDGRLDRSFARRGIATARIPLKPGGYSNRPRQILLSHGKVLVLRENRERQLVVYSGDGRARHAARVARGAEAGPPAARAPFGALQDGRLVLGWQVFSTPALFKLQRLQLGAGPRP